MKEVDNSLENKIYLIVILANDDYNLLNRCQIFLILLFCDISSISCFLLHHRAWQHPLWKTPSQKMSSYLPLTADEQEEDTSIYHIAYPRYVEMTTLPNAKC